ncbi:beta-N-acetylhexosaminidase [Arenibacter certesii]|uniref:beta-N-acetylhexosaminidase n=1 Tax=Arenibacter certesii TaxID=228955 RepID=A0A918IR78_9FLAO|nr:family 20 glycosylhydrolase [Arenibacter certesii]GGW27547.1 beta-hexosaminidase [Arenibacter certesii]
MKKKVGLWLSLIMLLTIFGCADEGKTVFKESDINIIPQPDKVQFKEGAFRFTKDTQFVVPLEYAEVAEVLLDKFSKAAGWNLRVVDTEPINNYVQLVLDDALENEAYNVIITGDKVEVTANGYAGFLYGLETLRQLLPVAIESDNLVVDVKWDIPTVQITDSPRFKWRGFMMDVSRHFFNKEYILSTIDQLALLKMNTLHLHLVDDQGWRLEIKKYPKLTEVGAFRVDQEDKHWDARQTPKLGEQATYGGFYTQEDIKEIVAYATSRGINVVPEIEMPAHVMSAIAAYPELSCLQNPIMVPSGGVWPITEIYCAGKESTFEFLENVLIEVMDLFPSQYIHVGGDEATKTNWEKCPDCSKRVKVEGLANVEELQSYFIKRMERFISSKGRTLIGWDEILEGGLAPGATVMSWRGFEGGLEASASGHDVVMSPTSHAYFDYYQGNQDTEPMAWGGHTPLSKVYEFDPVVEGMTPKQENHVLGGQANLWTEFVPTVAQAQYMTYPRLAALAESVWSTKENKNWSDFSARIDALFNRYDAMGINYAKSAYQVTTDVSVDPENGTISIALKNEFPNADIRYALDGNDITTSSQQYDSPIEIAKTTEIRAQVFKDEEPVGVQLEKTINFHKAAGKPVTYLNKYHDNYQGAKEIGMVNVVRGSKNFHDGQWQGWLGDNMILVIDMETPTEIEEISVGSLENQGSGIYFPVEINVLLSDDGKTYKKEGTLKRDFAANIKSELKDFVIDLNKQTTRFVKVEAINLGTPPTGGGSWMFIDEIIMQ